VRRLFLLPLVLACTGCAGASVQAEVTSRPEVGPAMCRPADLHGLFRGFQGAGDALAGAVVVVDAGPRPCLLNGSPQSVGLLDDGGGAVSVHERAVDLPPGGAVELQPSAALPAFGAPPTHGSAWVSLVWSNWCRSSSPSVRSTLVVLPAGGSIAAPLDSALPAWAVGPPAPRCTDSRAPSSLTFGRFRPAA
jgi:hypothetical protein